MTSPHDQPDHVIWRALELIWVKSVEESEDMNYRILRMMYTVFGGPFWSKFGRPWICLKMWSGRHSLWDFQGPRVTWRPFVFHAALKIYLHSSLCNVSWAEVPQYRKRRKWSCPYDMADCRFLQCEPMTESQNFLKSIESTMKTHERLQKNDGESVWGLRGRPTNRKESCWASSRQHTGKGEETETTSKRQARWRSGVLPSGETCSPHKPQS